MDQATGNPHAAACPPIPARDQQWELPMPADVYGAWREELIVLAGNLCDSGIVTARRGKVQSSASRELRECIC